MKAFYLAATISENGKFYPFIKRVLPCENLKSILEGFKGLEFINICESKKDAAALVEFWRDCYKKNGTYLFSEPLF